MKSSRAMLLAAMLFAAPVLADEAGQVQGTNTETQNTAKTPEAPKAEVSMLQRARELAIAPFAFVLATAPDFIAENTFGRLAAIEYLKGGKVAEFLGHKYTGRAAVYAVTAVAAYKLYQAMNPQDDSNDDEDIFGE